MQRKNKKIRNATVVKTGGITFKSQLEKMAYNCLIQEGFNPKYEPVTFTLIEGFDSKTPFYDKETDSQFEKRKSSGDVSPRRLVKKSNKGIQGIRYTPDFYLKYGNLDVWIEMKGIENDVHYIKKKLFRRLLDTQKGYPIYFEIYTKKQLLQAIEIIKEYDKSIEENRKAAATSAKEGC